MAKRPKKIKIINTNPELQPHVLGLVIDHWESSEESRKHYSILNPKLQLHVLGFSIDYLESFSNLLGTE
jgi:hypothetical protein